VLTHGTAGALLYSLSKHVLILEIGGVSILLSTERQTENAPYLGRVTINRTQLELYADGLIFKLGKRNAWEATKRIFIVVYWCM
jgi:hypothetical protein